MKRIIIPFFIFFATLLGFLAFTKTSYAAACDSGGSWSDCVADNPNAGHGGACGDNSGNQKIIYNKKGGKTNCTPTTVTRNCPATPGQACNSNICLNNKCVQCTDANIHVCSGNQHCGADNKCADNKPCDSGGSWSDCKADNPNAAIGAACGANSGSQKITRTAGSKNCSPHPVTRNCQPPEAQACSSNLCSDANKCIKCKNDNQCGDNQKCENNACVQKAPPPPVCDKNPPSIDVNPNNRNGDPGEEKAYDVKVTNNDTGKDCDPVTFVLSKEHLPTDKWTGQFDDNTLSISKNDSKSTKFKVKSPASANGGPKTITLGARKQAQQEAQVKTYFTYTVAEPPTPTPTKKPDPAPAKEGSPLVMGIAIQEGHASRDGREAKTLAAIDNFARSVGQYPGTFSIWTNFETDGWEFGPRGTFPNTTLLNGLYKRHITPVVFMQPVGGNSYSNDAIAGGSVDAYLTTWANAARAYNKPIILRYAHEMNGNWFSWSPGKQGNTPANYITAWQHIYNVVKPIAPNVKFFWCPMQGQDAMSKYFPGKDFVDYIGFDSYERASNDRSMADLYRPSIAELRALPIPKNSDGSSKIPMIIGETGILINFSNRGKWLSDGYPAVNSQFPDVAAIIYFNFDMNNLFGVAAEPGVNWLLSAGTDMRPAYANLAGKSKFRGAFSPFSSTAAPPSGDPDPTENPNPTPTDVPNPTDEPNPTDTPNPTDGPNPTQEPTPTPTPTPIPTPTPTFPPGSTILSITVGIDGIGTTARIPIGGNVDPKRKTRDLDVRLYKVEDNTLAYSKTQTFTYNSSIKKFQATFDISDFPGTGTYNIYLLEKPYLTGRLPGSATIVSQQTTIVDSTSFNLTTGNINSIDQSENKVDLMDYQVLLSCSIYAKEKETCNKNPDYATYSDLNDDGIVDQDDYTLFLKEFGNEGAILP